MRVTVCLVRSKNEAGIVDAISAFFHDAPRIIFVIYECHKIDTKVNGKKSKHETLECCFFLFKWNPAIFRLEAT